MNILITIYCLDDVFFSPGGGFPKHASPTNLGGVIELLGDNFFETGSNDIVPKLTGLVTEPLQRPQLFTTTQPTLSNR